MLTILAASLLLLLSPASGWLGASLVKNVPQGGRTLSQLAETAGLENIFPTSISHFFRHVYDTEVAYVNRNLTHRTPRARSPFVGLWPESPQEALDVRLRSIFETFVSEGKHTKKSSLSLVQPGMKYKSALLPERGPNATFEGLQRCGVRTACSLYGALSPLFFLLFFCCSLLHSPALWVVLT